MKKKTASQHGTSENEGKAWGNGQFANMPKDVKMEPYPTKPYHMDEGLDDTLTRIDGDTKQASKGFRKNLDRGMY